MIEEREFWRHVTAYRPPSLSDADSTFELRFLVGLARHLRREGSTKAPSSDGHSNPTTMTATPTTAGPGDRASPQRTQRTINSEPFSPGQQDGRGTSAPKSLDTIVLTPTRLPPAKSGSPTQPFPTNASLSQVPMSPQRRPPPQPASPSHPTAGDNGRPGSDRPGSQPPMLRTLQHVYTFLQPIDQLRFGVVGVSVGAMSTVVLAADGSHTIFGTTVPAAPHPRRFVGVAAGGSHVAFVDQNLRTVLFGTAFGAETVDTPGNRSGGRVVVSNGLTARLVSRDGKLLSLTTSGSVVSITTSATNSSWVIPWRQMKWLAVGSNDACFMVGRDSILYKTSMSTRAASTPRRVVTMSRHGLATVAAGAGYFAAIDNCGRLWTSGKNARGQLGNGKREDSMRLPFGHSKFAKYFFVSVACGNDHTLVLSANGTVFGCGCNAVGQLGVRLVTDYASTLTRIHLNGRCVGIAAGPQTSVFVMADGSVYGCGSNDCGLLGVSLAKRSIGTPTLIPGLRPAKGVASYYLDSATGKPVFSALLASDASSSPLPPTPRAQSDSTTPRNGAVKPVSKAESACACCVAS